MLKSSWFSLCACYLMVACQQNRPDTAASTLFINLSPDSTGVIFENQLTVDSSMNVFLYRNYYNGGGVAIGDVTGDGLEDIYFSSNMGDNVLYRNEGNMRFTDITSQAGVAGARAWSTGVAMADVNGDGLLDIYVCNSGDVNGDSKENELFINLGNGGFADKASEYGLADAGFSTHATFFDYDHDGDLDCYMLNNSFRPISTLGLRNLRNQRDELGGDKLYRNDGGKFVDVSAEAGIYGSVIGFGLGVSAGDVTGDGWEDLYISNDFYERDYLYVNNQKGGFDEQLISRMRTISNFSMGADISDLDNDGASDIFVTDMLPKEDKRLKLTTRFSSYDEYLLKIERGFHHQSIRNTLQHNRGDGTFEEIGQLLGVEATDWSWGALIADLDNNGHKDIFVSNGVLRDVTDQDFISFFGNDENVEAAKAGKPINFQTFVDRMSSTKVGNYAFANRGNLILADSSEAWGLSTPSHSNGSAYADLDQDGDLDLVISALNGVAEIYQNQASDQKRGAATRLTIKGDGQNPFSLGAIVRIYKGEDIIQYAHLPVRGFQSSMTYQPAIGLGASLQIDSLVAIDPYGRRIFQGPTILSQSTVLDFSKANKASEEEISRALAYSAQLVGQNAVPLFEDVTSTLLEEPIYHLENKFVDFDRDRLLYLMNSIDGPCMASGSLDGQKDQILFLGGSAGDISQLFRYDIKTSKYLPLLTEVQKASVPYEDGAAAFIDLDGDGDEDLLVGSTGSEYFGNSRAYSLRVYEQVPLRNGDPTFIPSRKIRLPPLDRPVNTIAVADFDRDGDLDFATASRLHVQGYGLPSPIAVYINDGGGQFRLPRPEGEKSYASGGMISSLKAVDLNGDNLPELVAVGEFMPVTIFSSKDGLLNQMDTIPGSSGLYRSLEIADLNGDGKPELICGNLGNNSFLTATKERSLQLYYGDLDSNGEPEHIYTRTIAGKEYPLALKSDLQAIMPSIKKKFIKFADYADKPLSSIFDANAIKLAYRQQAETTATTVYSYDEALNRWIDIALPWQAQVSMVTAIKALDVDGDGDLDLLLGGNFYGTQARIGGLEASRGTVLINENGILKSSPPNSGFNTPGQVRSFMLLQPEEDKELVVVARNSGPLQFLRLRQKLPQ